MTMQHYEYFVRRHEWSDSIALNIACVIDGDRYHMVAPAFKKLTLGEATPENSTLSLTRDDAQRLMDDLYRIGVRPTEVGSIGQVAAMQAHLNDMRRLVFDEKIAVTDGRPVW